MKERIFIGSSAESKAIAEDVKRLLESEYSCQLWYDDFFELGQCTYRELVKKSISFDYAIFIGGKEDYVKRLSDGTHKYAVRDNVYLEFGLYVGVLSYARNFFLLQKGCKIASDLLGVNAVIFNKIEDIESSITKIKQNMHRERMVNRVGFLPSTSLAVGYFEHFLKPVSQAICQMREIYIAGEQYDMKNRNKKIEIFISANVSEDLRSWSNYVFQSHAIEKVAIDANIRKIGVNVDCDMLKNAGIFRIVDVPLTLSVAYKSVDLVLGVDYIGKEDVKEFAKEKELNNFISTLNHLVETDIYTRKNVEIKKYMKQRNKARWSQKLRSGP